MMDSLRLEGKRVQNTCVMQPISLFSLRFGTPDGPSKRLLRKLSDEVTVDEAIKEWKTRKKEGSAVSLTDPTSMKHPCTGCYLNGNKDNLLDAYHFAVCKATDFYDMYVSQGRWTRWVHGMEEARIKQVCRKR